MLLTCYGTCPTPHGESQRPKGAWMKNIHHELTLLLGKMENRLTRRGSEGVEGTSNLTHIFSLFFNFFSREDPLCIRKSLAHPFPFACFQKFFMCAGSVFAFEKHLPGTPKSPILSGYFGPVAFYSVTLRFSCVKT